MSTSRTLSECNGTGEAGKSKGGSVYEYSEEQLWEKTNVSSILKADVGQHDNDSNESRDDQTNSSVSGDDIGSESAEDYSDDEDEGEDDYKPGGYDEIRLGSFFNRLDGKRSKPTWKLQQVSGFKGAEVSRSLY